MAEITIERLLPSGERADVYIDGVLLGGESFAVGEGAVFGLRVVERRQAAEPEGFFKDLFARIGALFCGGNFEKVAEISAPYYAVYEAECRAASDGTLCVSLFKEKNHAAFAVSGDSLHFENVFSGEKIKKRELGRWIASLALFLLPFTAVAAFAVSLSFWADWGASSLFFRILFPSLFLSALIFVWGRVLLSVAPKKISGKDVFACLEKLSGFLKGEFFVYLAAGLLSFFAYLFHWFDCVYPCLVGSLLFIVTAAVTANILDDNAGSTREAWAEALSARRWRLASFFSAAFFVCVNVFFCLLLY